MTVMASGHFEPLVRRAGLEFLPVGTAEDYQAMALQPDLWHPVKGFRLIMESAIQILKPVPHRRRSKPGDSSEGTGPTNLAQHCGILQQRLVGRIQGVEAGGDDALDGLRQRHVNVPVPDPSLVKIITYTF